MKSRLQSSTSNVPPETIFILLLFVVTLILVSPKLLPSYQEINPHDETKYVESGRIIVDSQDIRELGRSPLVSLIYAVIYLFISQSLDWFMLSVGIGRVILFTLVWFGTIYLGLRFRTFSLSCDSGFTWQSQRCNVRRNVRLFPHQDN